MELYMGVFSNDPLFAAPRTVAHQAPLSMEFSSQEYWSGLPFPSPGDLPDAGIKLASLALASRFFPIWATREACLWSCRFFNRCSRVPLDSGKATCTLATQTTPSLVPRAAKRQTWGGDHWPPWRTCAAQSQPSGGQPGAGRIYSSPHTDAFPLCCRILVCTVRGTWHCLLGCLVRWVGTTCTMLRTWDKTQVCVVILVINLWSIAHLHPPRTSAPGGRWPDLRQWSPFFQHLKAASEEHILAAW